MNATLRNAVFAALSLCALNAAAAVTPEQVEAATAKVDANVIAWRRDIHQHPELSNRETRTSALVAAHLKKLGLEVRTGIAKTGVTAVLRGGNIASLDINQIRELQRLLSEAGYDVGGIDGVIGAQTRAAVRDRRTKRDRDRRYQEMHGHMASPSGAVSGSSVVCNVTPGCA